MQVLACDMKLPLIIRKNSSVEIITHQCWYGMLTSVIVLMLCCYYYTQTSINRLITIIKWKKKQKISISQRCFVACPKEGKKTNSLLLTNFAYTLFPFPWGGYLFANFQKRHHFSILPRISWFKEETYNTTAKEKRRSSKPFTMWSSYVINHENLLENSSHSTWK